MLMFEPLKKYADFQGRARRSEYWLFALFCWVAGMVTGSIDGLVAGGIPMLSGVLGLALLIPSLAVGFRRLHDTNRSAWWILIAFIPVLGWLVLLVFMVLDGTAGPNQFGPDPKGRGETNAEAFA